MNIIKYKNIDDLVQKKDIYLAQEIGNDELKLISKGYVPTKFNIGVNDVLEFSLYDANNNLLTQEIFGPVRYIKGEEIKNYLLVSNNISDQVSEGGGFVVDIKKLIKEAGYNTGYFRVQVNFTNNRVGSNYPKDRLWIQEISPSRLEMRLLPFNNFDEKNVLEDDIKKDLNESYDSFVLGKFSGDEVYQEIYAILDSLKASDVANIMKTVLTSATIDKLAQEFNIVGGYDLFYSRVLDDMKKAVINELLYRNSIIGSNDFGKPISDTLRNKISQKDYQYYTKNDIISLLNIKFKESVEYHLPKRNLNENLRLDEKTLQSLEDLGRVVQTLESNTVFQLPTITLETLTPPPPPPTPSPSRIEEPSTPPPPPPPIIIPLTYENGPTVIPDITSAVLQFMMSEESTSKVNFLNGLCPTEGCELFNNNYSKGKRFLFSGLIPNTIYTILVETKTLDGKIAKSAPVTFTTLSQVSNEPILDPYTPTSGGGGGRGFIYRDPDLNPDTIETSIGDFTTQIK